MTPEEIAKAQHNALLFRESEQKINDQIRSLRNRTPSPTTAAELARLTKQAEAKRKKAQHWEDRARAGAL